MVLLAVQWIGPGLFDRPPGIKSPLSSKAKHGGQRLGSTTHFYCARRCASGIDPEKDVTIPQLGTGTEAVSAMKRRIAMAALTTRYALPLLQRGWPMFVELSTTDLVYPRRVWRAAARSPKRSQKWSMIFCAPTGRRPVIKRTQHSLKDLC